MPGILLISDTTEGGAAIACRRLYEGLRRAGSIEVRWLAVGGAPMRGAQLVRDYVHSGALVGHRLLSRLPVGERMLDRSARFVNECTVLAHIRSIRPDLLSLHNIHETMTFSFVERIPRQLPIAWTLHDMWPLTAGYCTYRLDCKAFGWECAGCPRMEPGRPIRFSRDERIRRKEFLQRNRHRLALVSPSRWLAREVSDSIGREVHSVCIPNCVNTEIYRPIGSVECARRCLGLPLDEQIILVGADSLSDERKGSQYLVQAMGLLRDRGRRPHRVVAFGMPPSASMAPHNWLFTGYIRDERLLNLYYGAADVFVLPSRAEAFGLVYAEAMAAGTPCVGFRVAACPEVIREGQTGYLARDADSESLASCILRVLELDRPARETMRHDCRALAEAEFNMVLHATRYSQLFEHMVADRRAEGRAR